MYFIFSDKNRGCVLKNIRLCCMCTCTYCTSVFILERERERFFRCNSVETYQDYVNFHKFGV